MSTQRETSVNDNTMNIRAGIPVLKQKYGLTTDEYDYIDCAIDLLRDINTYGATAYLAIIDVDESGNALLPCNISVIDAVTTVKMGLKVFDSRVKYDLQSMLGTDAYFTATDIMASARPTPKISTMVRERPYMDHGLAEHSNYNVSHTDGIGRIGYQSQDRYNRREDDGYVTYQLIDPKNIAVDQKYAGDSIAIAFTGISVDHEGYPLITRKQSNAIAVGVAKNILTRRALSGDQGAANSLQYIVQEAGRLIQAAAIPENITDNELDQVLDAKTSFNRKSYRRPSSYSR